MNNDKKSEIPEYLEKTYWWAYLHPLAVAFFERQWLVNLILFGNYKKLRNALIDELDIFKGSRSLQLACAYGDFTESVLKKINGDGCLDVIDVLPIQISNLEKKLSVNNNPIALHVQNSNQLFFDDDTFDNVVSFFLLHEQPGSVRKKTVLEAIRVCKSGGKIIYVDYHRPDKSLFLRSFMVLVLRCLEPFALDLWKESIDSLHDSEKTVLVSKQTYFFGLYQCVVIRKK